MAERNAAEATAEAYYDSHDADAFYERVWGGEDIHIGLYASPSISIADASRATADAMAARLGALPPDTRVLDLGAGYGGAARWLAQRFGWRVSCLNLSERQNARNRLLTAEQGLEQAVRVVHGSFEQVPEPDASFEVVWSQDALLHSGRRRRVLEEAHRVLVRGGSLVFTDPMQADDCPPGVLQPVYDRLELTSLGSFAEYRKLAAEIGFEDAGALELTPHLRSHYARVHAELEGRYRELCAAASPAYVDRMLEGLRNWVEAADAGYLAWGILHFRAEG